MNVGDLIGRLGRPGVDDRAPVRVEVNGHHVEIIRVVQDLSSGWVFIETEGT